MSSVDENVRRRFEAARLSGSQEPLETFLPAEDHPQWAGTLRELLCIEREIAWKRFAEDDGEMPAPIQDVLALHSSLDDAAREIVAEEDSLLAARFGHGDVEATLFDPTGPRTGGSGSAVESTQIVSGDERSEPGWTRHDEPSSFSTASASAPPLGKGVRVGRYEIRRLLGRGGFAQVWSAWDGELKREVALKISRPDAHMDGAVLERIRREAQSAARLQHPAIVPVYEVGAHEGCPYIVSRLLPGPDLASVLRDGRPDVDQTVRWLARLARATEYAHQCGIVHRDIKPANVLLDEDGEPALTDFGLARQDDADVAMTQEGDLLGTPAYMSPEQARGANEDVDGRSDVYALGVLMYELLCGRRPFEGKVAAEVIHAVLYEDPKPPGRIRPDLPRDLDTIVQCAMAKERERRYATAGRLADDLDRFIERRPIEARRRGVVGRVALWCRRNPAFAATAIIAVLVIAGVGFAGIRGVLDERERFRRQRDVATDRLYTSLVGEAAARITARETSWRQIALESLATAASSASSLRDPVELRTMVARCVAIPEPSFTLEATWEMPDARPLAVHWSRDGKLLAVGDSDGNVRLLRRADGSVRATLSGGESGIRCVEFHPTRPGLVAAGDGEGVLHLWSFDSSLADGADVPEVRTVEFGNHAVNGLDWAPDGGRLALALGAENRPGPVVMLRYLHEDADLPRRARVAGDPDDAGPWLFDRKVLPGHAKAARCVAFSTDGTRLASGSDDAIVSIWDVESGASLSSHNVNDPVGRMVAWDDRWIVTHRQNYGVSVIDANDPFPARSFGGLHTGASNAVALTERSWPVTCGDDGVLRCWTPDFKPFGIADGKSGPQYEIAAAGDRIAVAGRRAIQIWDVNVPAGTDAYHTGHVSSFVGDTRVLATSLGLREFGGAGSPVWFKSADIRAMDVARGRVWYGGSNGVLRWAPTAGGAGGQTEIADEAVAELAARPDGRGVAVVTVHGRAFVWDGTSSTEIEGLTGVRGAAWGANETLYLSTDDAVVAVEGGRPRKLTGRAGSNACIAATDGRLAFGAVDEIVVWDLEKSAVITKLAHPKVSSIAWSPRGDRLVAASPPGGVRYWSTGDWAEARMSYDWAAHPDWVALDPRGEYVIWGGHLCSWIVVQDLERGPVAQLPASNSSAGAFVEGGAGLIVATANGALLRWSRSVFEAESRRLEDAAEGGIAAAPGRPQPATGLFGDGTKGGHRTAIWGTSASPDGRWVATCSHDGEVKIWDTSTGVLDSGYSHGGLAWCTAFTRDSKYALSGSGNVILYDVEAGEIVRATPDDRVLVTGITCHPTEPWAAIARLDGRVEIWHYETDRPPRLLKARASVARQVAFSPDNDRLSVAFGDHGVLIWNMGTPEWRAWFEDETGNVAPPKWGRLDLHDGKVDAVAYSPDGRWFASGDANGEIILIDRHANERWASLRTRTKNIRSLSFSADSALLAAGAWDAKSVTWDVAALVERCRELGIDP